MNLKDSFYIAGEIDSKMTLALLNHLSLVEKNKATVFFNSEGGSVTDGFAMYDLIKASNLEIEMIGVGQIQSIAILPFLACKVRKCTVNTRFMFHHGTFEMTQPEGQKEMVGIVKELMEQDVAYQQAIVEHTNLSLREVKKKMKHGFYFDAQEALEMGFVQEIVGV